MAKVFGKIILLTLLFAILTPPLFYAAAHGPVALEFFTTNFIYKICAVLFFSEIVSEIFLQEHDFDVINIYGFLTNILGYFFIFGAGYCLFLWVSKEKFPFQKK